MSEENSTGGSSYGTHLHRDNNHNSNNNATSGNGTVPNGAATAATISAAITTANHRHDGLTVQQQPGQELQISNAGTWDAINAAGLQLSASAGMATAAATAGIPLPAANLLLPATSSSANTQPQQQQHTPVARPWSFPPIPPAATIATHAQHPYLLMKPQHSNPVLTGAATPSTLASGGSTSLDAVAAAAGLVNYGTPSLLFHPASLLAATQQTGHLPLQIHHQQQTHPHPQMILPAAVPQPQSMHMSQQSQSPPPMSISATGVSHNYNPNINNNMNAVMANNPVAPSIVSSAVTTGNPKIMKRSEGGQKRQRGGGGGGSQTGKEVPSNTTDSTEQRRYERNMREQQRSSKISSQIKELRELLTECNVPFKPNKYSILLKVVEYIKQLQSRAIMLDAEHQKLTTTVRQTNEATNNNNGLMSFTTDNELSDAACVDSDWRHGRGSGTIPASSSSRESDLFFVKGIDYRSVFDQCPTAMGIAALDGRILECNTEFQSLLGYHMREELLKQSLFNLVHNHQDIFQAMAQMLKVAEGAGMNHNGSSSSRNHDDRNMNTSNIQESIIASTTTSDGPSSTGTKSNDRFWTGPVTSKQNVQLSMNITLTLGDKGTPKFFSCALTNASPNGWPMTTGND